MCNDCFKEIVSYLDINLYEDIIIPNKGVLNYWRLYTKYTESEVEDRKEWRRNGKRHRDGDLPSIVWSNGHQLWYRNGKLHRDGDLPAVIWRTGKQEWWRNGERYTPN